MVGCKNALGTPTFCRFPYDILHVCSILFNLQTIVKGLIGAPGFPVSHFFYSMNTKSFFLHLVLVTFGTALLLAGLHFYAPQARLHGQFSVATVVLFIVICLGLYFAGASTARAKNKHAFTNLVSVSVFGKMVLAVGYLFLYQQVEKPQNEWFVGIFLLCYIIYTGFEVWFMTKLAKR